MRARRIAVALGAAGLIFAGTAAGPRQDWRRPREGGQGPVSCENGSPTTRGPAAETGLGPLYNANSCVACHSVGGAGGSGPNDKNAEIVTASMTLRRRMRTPPTCRWTTFLFQAYPAFKASRSVVLHKSGVSTGYADWKRGLRQGAGRFSMTVTSRNTPALFGAGLIDAIPDAVLEAEEKRTFAEFPEIQGRVSRLANGKLGRFGWKGQTATLEDFVRTACAVELGLEVPGHPQDARTPSGSTTGPLGLVACPTPGMLGRTTAYLAGLPRPGIRPAFNASQDQGVQIGMAEFKTIGCAECHAPKLGDVDGLYSDLLLHDMGEGLVDSAIYYGTPVPPPKGEILASADLRRAIRRAARSGVPRRCGGCATPAPISTTAARPRSTWRFRPTAARRIGRRSATNPCGATSVFTSSRS